MIIKSLQGRIALLLIVIALSILALFTFGTYEQTLHTNRHNDQRLAVLITKTLGSSAPTFIHQVVSKPGVFPLDLGHIDQLRGLTLRDATGKPLFQYQRPDLAGDKIWRTNDSVPNQKSCQQCHVGGNHPLAFLEIEFSSPTFSEIIFANETQIFFVIIFFLIIALALGGSLINRSLVNPISNLLKTIAAVEEGDWQARATIRQPDELGLLGEKFNSLIERLAEREGDAQKLQELRGSFNLKLLRQVEEIQNKHNMQMRLLIAANHLSANLITTFELPEILKSSLECLHSEFGFEQMTVCVLDEEHQMIEGKAGVGVTQIQIMQLQFPWDNKVFEGILSLANNDRMEKAFQVLNEDRGIRDKFFPLFGEETPFFILPLLAKYHLRGLLALKQTPFTQEDIAEYLPALKMVANQTAMALENTRLYGEVNRINVDLSQRIDEIGTLNEIGQLLNSILNLDDLLELFIFIVTKEMKAEIGSIMLINKATNSLEIKAAKGLDAETIKNTSIHLGEGISGWVALHKKPLLIKDIETDKMFGRPNRPKYETKSLVCVPIISKGEAIGVVSINNRLGGGEYDENDLEFLKTLANQAAISLENAQLYKNLQKNYYDTIKSLILTLEAKDPYTKGHSQRVTEYVLMIGRALGIPPEAIEMLEYAGILHDIGKIGISEFLLTKQGKLTSEEYQHIQKHPLIGESIIEPIEFLADIRPMIRHHHERFDGLGYPDHLLGDANSLEARILSVADAYDAMTTNRPYRNGLSKDEAIRELLQNKGTQFDGEIVDIFVQLLKEREQKIH